MFPATGSSTIAAISSGKFPVSSMTASRSLKGAESVCSVNDWGTPGESGIQEKIEILEEEITSKNKLPSICAENLLDDWFTNIKG